MTVEAQAVKSMSKLWWLWLVVGILWILISFVILQFDVTSAATVGIIVGVMFLVAGIQYFILGSQVEGYSWVWYLIGALLVVGGLAALFYPTRTFLAIANILGFVFVLIGITWVVEAFMARRGNDLWWLGLVSGIIMLVLGFWLAGEYFITQARTLLVFAGVWALMRGIMDIIMAFQIKKLADG